MVVYIDILILENIIVNCFLLELTARTIRVKTKLKYLILAGILGSMYVLVLFFPGASFLDSLPFKLLVAVIMVITAFRSCTKSFILKAGAIFILYSMLLAGICIFMEFSKGLGISQGNIENFTFSRLLVALMIILLTFDRLSIFIKERRQVEQLIYRIDIIFGSKYKSVNGFLDTGNELREPVTNMPVIIVNEDIYSSLFTVSYDKYYIPYRIFNGSTGRLEAFKPDYINIYIGNDIIKKNAVVAMSNEKFGDAGEYEALLPRGILI